jgi:preprotein translocase subunit SecD
MKNNNNNHFKKILCVFLILFSFIYSLPNFFEKDAAVGIVSKNEGRDLIIIEDKIKNKKEELGYEEYFIQDNSLFVVYKSISEQMSGYERINEIAKDDFYVNLNLISTQPKWLTKFGASPANLGLDLRGGVHFLMEVDTEELMSKKLKSYKKDIENTLNVEGTILENKAIFPYTEEVLDYLESNFLDSLDIVYLEETDEIECEIKELKKKDFIDSVVKQNIITLNNRVNEIGVAEPTIQRQGENRIIIQLPGIQDTSKAKEIVGATATLDFKAVDEDAFMKTKNNVLIEMLDGTGSYYFKAGSIISGESIIDASSGFDIENNTSIVSVSLDQSAGNVMLEYTTKNKGKLMGSILKTVQYETKQLEDGTLVKNKIVTKKAINVARISGVFSNRFQITGLDDKEEAHKLAILLRSGALAAPVEIIEERTIGPNMGAENIKKGKISILIGFALVLILMAIKYRTLGMIANFCVFINMFALLAILSSLGATLTLPGIAGIILTVGMAVDANVVIFERIKEEYAKKGKVKKSIESGFAKALSSIIDANITTFIAALVLFGIGSGAVKGFAVTLLIGIITSLITSIFLSKTIIEMVYKNKKEIKF